MLDNYVFDCVAFRTMKAGPRALLFELIRLHNGTNNGSIGLGARRAAVLLGANKDTANKYFWVLMERGFIAPARPGGFNMKDPESRRSTEWRLTWIKTNCMPATKDFLNFGKKNAVPKIQTTGTENADVSDGDVANRPKKTDLLGKYGQPVGPKNPDTYTSSHRRGSNAGEHDRAVCALAWEAIRNHNSHNLVR
tara:strand:- start:6630 stop:7211 length:582 start_codon:yes stop_codon:yes gene_type:complete